MRLRNKPWTDQFLIDNKEHLLDFNEFGKREKDFFSSQQVHLEIGCGKGTFITQKSILNPNINYIGIEKEKTVIGVALKRTLKVYEDKEIKMKNLKFTNKNINLIEDLIEPNSVSKIYLNFSDPWPKKRHSKYRLTGINFLNLYYKILKSGSLIEIKTDNDGLYDFTLQEIEKSQFKLLYKTTDLYKDKEQLSNNIATEYEKNFHESGKNINKLILKKCKDI